MIETLNPTAATTADATVDNGAAAFDGNPATAATVRELAVGASAMLDLHGFPDGVIPPISRAAVRLKIRARWKTADLGDAIRIGVSKDNGQTFREVDSRENLDFWPAVPNAAAEKVFDVTGLVGTAAISDVRVRIQFANGQVPGFPPPPFEE